MNNFEDLLKIVPPPAKPQDPGSPGLWKRVKAKINLPDGLYDFYHRYGSGSFAVYNEQNQIADIINLLNVFEEPLLKNHILEGQGFSLQNEHAGLPVTFFPQTPDSLFPVTCSSHALLLLIDPSKDANVYHAERFLTLFEEFDVNLFDFLCLSFAQSKDFGFLSISKESRVSKVKFFERGSL